MMCCQTTCAMAFDTECPVALRDLLRSVFRSAPQAKGRSWASLCSRRIRNSTPVVVGNPTSPVVRPLVKSDYCPATLAS